MTKKNSPSTPLPFSNKSKTEIWLVNGNGVMVKIINKKRLNIKPETDLNSLYLMAIDRKLEARKPMFLRRDE